MPGGVDPSLLLRVLRDHDEGCSVFDRDYTFLWLNETAAWLLRGQVDDLLGDRLFDRFPEGRDTVVWTAYEAAFETQQVQEFRLWYGPLEGWFRVRAVPSDDRLVAWFRNVDHEQAAEEEREELRASHVRSGERSERLLDVVAALSRARSLVEVIDVVLDRGFGLLGGYGGGVGFISEDRQHLDVVELRNFGGDIRDRWIGRFPLDADVPMMISANTGQPLFYGALGDVQQRYPAIANDFGERTEAFVSLPLSVDRGVIGALVVMFDSEQRFGDDEREFMLTLAGLCAQALERARLSARERDIAVTLQRSLLPAVDDVPSLDVAVRYVPGAEGTEVGGDWYDVIQLGAGRVALTIGDVMGRGVQAAALMGQVRAAVRAYAHLDMPPAQVISSLDAVVSDIGEGSFVTCSYALFDPADSTLTVCCAGHLPPVVVDSAGSAIADVTAGPPLGLGLRVDVEEHVLALRPGAVVAMCTDGLVESRDKEAEAGLAELAALLARTGQASLEDLADAAIESLLADDTADDAALLLVRPQLSPADTAPWLPLTRTPEAVGDVRRHLYEVAAANHLSPDFTDSVAVVASELVTNAIRHGRGDPCVRLRLTPTRAVVEVEDSSGHLPQRRFADDEDEGGRGLELVAWLSGRWGWRPTAHGKVVWAELVPASG